MDASEMRELLHGYLEELDWGAGATMDGILAHLAGRDEALRTMVNEYVAEGTYPTPEVLINVLPAQAWHNAQGARWRGADGLVAEGAESGYQASLAGQDQPSASRAGGPPPPTPGFGTIEPEEATAGNAAGSGTQRAAWAGSRAAGGSLGSEETAGEGMAPGAASGHTPGTGATDLAMTDADPSDAMTSEPAPGVDVVVVGVDVDGDGTPDVVVADAMVYDETLGGGAGEGAGSAD